MEQETQLTNEEKLKTLGCYNFGNKPYSLKVHHLLDLCGIKFLNFNNLVEAMDLDSLALIYYIIDNRNKAADDIYTFVEQTGLIEQAKEKLSNEDYLGYQLSACNRIINLRQIALDYLDDKYNMPVDKLKEKLFDYWKKEVLPWGNISELENNDISILGELDKKKE